MDLEVSKVNKDNGKVERLWRSTSVLLLPNIRVSINHCAVKTHTIKTTWVMGRTGLGHKTQKFISGTVK